MTVLSIDMILFDSHFIIEKYTLKNKYIIKTMIDNGSDGYRFVDPITAQEICETLGIEPVELIKYRSAKRYDGKIGPSITHVIYSKMIIGQHTESLAALMITSLVNHPEILRRPWMMKHDVIIDAAAEKYGETIIKWKKNHCDHLRAPERLFSDMSTPALKTSEVVDTAPTSSSIRILKRKKKLTFSERLPASAPLKTSKKKRKKDE